jgi:hypothetical protein
VSTNGALPLGEVRARAAAALAPAAQDDPEVLVDVVDSLTPPALMLMWQDPWLEPQSFQGIGAGSRGWWTASLAVRCVAGRVEPGPGVETLEQLVAYTLGRLMADDYTWPAATLTAPRVWPIGEVRYLFADVQYQVPVTV